MRCAYCGFIDSKVLDSRSVDDGTAIRRRRECLNCGKRFTTYERIEETPLIVIKQDNRREIFDSKKVLNGLLKACDKRPVPFSVLEETAQDIERELRNSLEKEVNSRQIGEMIMDRLKNIDEIAYVRFASVYRKFEDISSFMDEIKGLMTENK